MPFAKEEFGQLRQFADSRIYDFRLVVFAAAQQPPAADSHCAIYNGGEAGIALLLASQIEIAAAFVEHRRNVDDGAVAAKFARRFDRHDGVVRYFGHQFRLGATEVFAIAISAFVNRTSSSKSQMRKILNGNNACGSKSLPCSAIVI